MEIAMVVVFVLGYLAIALEHPLKVDKAASALILGTVTWALYTFSGADPHHVQEGLLHHLSEIAQILFFLMGAMTIVEIIDLHRGFEILKGAVNTKSKKKLLWIIGILAFILSAIIDNLTATIVLVTLLRKLIQNKEERLWYAGAPFDITCVA